jgi:hypothetical protein
VFLAEPARHSITTLKFFPSAAEQDLGFAHLDQPWGGWTTRLPPSTSETRCRGRIGGRLSWVSSSHFWYAPPHWARRLAVANGSQQVSSWICVLGRLYTRLKIVREPGWDDLCVFMYSVRRRSHHTTKMIPRLDTNQHRHNLCRSSLLRAVYPFAFPPIMDWASTLS